MLRKLPVIPVVAALLAVAPPASAQSPDQGFTFGARLGVAFPAGKILREQDSGLELSLDDQYKRAIPVILEAGYRFPTVTVGIYYQYGFATLQDGCDGGGVSCEEPRVKRFGAQVLAPLGNPGPMRPWLGGAIGWEWASFKMSDPSESMTLTWKGFDLTAQGGLDFEVAPKVYLGPYASVSLGRYTDAEVDSTFGSGSVDIDMIGDKRWHEWFQLGIRGRFDL